MANSDVLRSYSCNQVGLSAVDWLSRWNPRNTAVAAVAERLDG